MKRLITSIALLGVLVTPSSAADLEEARALLGDRPKEALAIARAALEANPHDLDAHRVAIKALKIMGRTDEAVPPLEKWLSEQPNEFAPLWILLDLHVWMKNWPAVANLVKRVPAEPTAERRKFLHSIVRTTLENERFVEAASTLAIAPPPEGSAQLTDAFEALVASAAGLTEKAQSSLVRFLTSGIDEDTQTQFLWWTAELNRIASAGPGPRLVKSKHVDGSQMLHLTATSYDSPAFKLAKEHGLELAYPLRKIEPVYPENARAQRIEGEVYVECLVLTTGNAAFPVVLVTTNSIFNDAVRKAMVGCRFKPARRNGQVEESYYHILIKFKL